MLKAEIKNITLTTDGKNREILSGINFTLDASKIYTILGRNGSGKSTLIKSLTNLLNSNIYRVDGKVFWLMENIYKMDTNRLLELRKKDIKYVLQDLTNNFDPLKKLKYYFDITGNKEKTISSHLRDFLLPDYSVISSLHPYEISGGMAQRLSLLFAMMANPKLLILDEPTSAIDYANMNLIKLKLIEFRKNGGTALVVTQDINFAKEISNEIAYLQNGTISGFKTCNTFFEDANSSNASFFNSYSELQ